MLSCNPESKTSLDGDCSILQFSCSTEDKGNKRAMLDVSDSLLISSLLSFFFFHASCNGLPISHQVYAGDLMLYRHSHQRYPVVVIHI